MGIGVGLILTAVGAILAWAVNWHSSSVNLHVIGIILFIVGIVGVLLSLVFWSSRGGVGARRGGPPVDRYYP